MVGMSSNSRPPAESALRARAARGVVSRLRGLVLLAGSVRAGELGRSIGRSILDLPLPGGDTALSAWVKWSTGVWAAADAPPRPLTVLLDHAGRAPTSAGDGANVELRRDSSELRGSGGVLRDLAAQADPDEWMLIASGAQVLVSPLPGLLADLIESAAPVALVAHDDGTPGGLILARCRELASLPAIGFVDLKEQALPRLAATAEVGVVRRARATAVPIRTLDGYLSAVRAMANAAAEPGADPAPPADDEDWRPTFALAEPGATVDPGARVHDSVILRGATIGARAVVVRSVVCGGASVPAGKTVADQVVAGGDERGRPNRRGASVHPGESR